MRRLRVLALMHGYLVPPENTESFDLATVKWKTEYDVVSTLEEMGHEVRQLGIEDDLGVIRKVIGEWEPQIVFNLLEAFDEIGVFDQNVVSYLELLRLPYTGCNPRGLILARDKALSKMLLSYHRIPVPEFVVFPRGRPVRRPKRLRFPLIVKSLTQEASIGIAQASVVESDDKLQERVAFVHRSVGTDAIVERYVDGRELYVGVLGNERLQVLPIWELKFDRMGDALRPIATERLKWSPKFQQKHGIETGPARDLPDPLGARVRHICKRVYRALYLSGYARIDLRLQPDGQVYVLEANPNPQIAYGEDFAESAEVGGISYEQLLQRILNLGLTWRPEKAG